MFLSFLVLSAGLPWRLKTKQPRKNGRGFLLCILIDTYLANYNQIARSKVSFEISLYNLKKLRFSDHASGNTIVSMCMIFSTT